ncbi:MAG: hypothetical protein Kow0031_09190 [Anaerolineae bacterium]
MTTAVTDTTIELAPEFTATDIEGRTVSLAGFRERQHVILVFNRGLA